MHNRRAVVHPINKQFATASNVVQRMLCNAFNTGCFDDDIEAVSSENGSSEGKAGGTDEVSRICFFDLRPLSFRVVSIKLDKLIPCS